MGTELKQVTEVIIPPLKPPIIANKLEAWWVRLRFRFRLFRRVYEHTNSLIESWRLSKQLRAKHREFFTTNWMGKIAKVDGRFFWHFFAPGAPSKAARQAFGFEIGKITGKGNPNSLRLLMFAITKKCPMHCEHCFEWGNLHQREVLTRNDIASIVQKFQEEGVSAIWFSGGEPMLRLDDIVHVLNGAKDTSDFWIFTSGYHLTAAAALQLKAAGLTGVAISLDHFQPSAHNQFRGHEGAFFWATKACENASKAGLVTALSLCATKAFADEQNLRQYMQLARQLGVSFVQVLEPRAAGHYAGKNVALSPSQVAILERLYVAYNTSPEYSSFPIIDYPSYHQRRVGCSAGGDRSLYVDTNGNVNICPFCRGSIANALEFPVGDLIQLSKQVACPDFEKAEV